MIYYRLTRDQEEYLRGVVAGKVVADLGCGDGSLAVTMANMGASVVRAVDKAPARIKHDGVVFHQSYFDRWTMPEDVQVAVLAWPQNNSLPGLTDLLNRSLEVVYLGKNTDGSACGTGSLFANLARRVVVKYLPDRGNVMIHYGNQPRGDARLHHEEFAALEQAKQYTYNEILDRRDAPSWKAQ